MLALGTTLAAQLAEIGILFDTTGDCMFLDVQKPLTVALDTNKNQKAPSDTAFLHPARA